MHAMQAGTVPHVPRHPHHFLSGLIRHTTGRCLSLPAAAFPFSFLSFPFPFAMHASVQLWSSLMLNLILAPAPLIPVSRKQLCTHLPYPASLLPNSFFFLIITLN
ncbi:hypothetical protein O6H91_07G032200 [Diphasiastrum complanatum]|uniref:Uncharacterized protein n=1 Tax=Diphasiastrum complanatum TaxID=34168 RepID=A0ACC2D454_DIPCM|nr:hypothetical protein O6H91_07G032200 [Diphasiastrum complanatum]